MMINLTTIEVVIPPPIVSEQDDGRQYKLETVSETSKEVGGSKINHKTARSKELPTYTSLF